MIRISRPGQADLLCPFRTERTPFYQDLLSNFFIFSFTCTVNIQDPPLKKEVGGGAVDVRLLR